MENSTPTDWHEVGRRFALDFSKQIENNSLESVGLGGVAKSRFRLQEYLELNFSGKMLPGIFSYLESDDCNYQHFGIIVVFKIGQLTKRKKECVDALLKAIEHFTPENRQLALQMLARLGAKQIVPELVKILSEGNGEEKEFAKESLISIKGGGFFFGNDDPLKWKKWWDENK